MSRHLVEVEAGRCLPWLDRAYQVIPATGYVGQLAEQLQPVRELLCFLIDRDYAGMAGKKLDIVYSVIVNYNTIDV